MKRLLALGFLVYQVLAWPTAVGIVITYWHYVLLGQAFVLILAGLLWYPAKWLRVKLRRTPVQAPTS